MVESPESPIGKDAPFGATMPHVEVNLVGGVFVAERVATCGFQRCVEGAVPVFGIGNRNGGVCEHLIRQRYAFLCLERRLVAVEHIVWPLRAAGCMQRGLHFKRVAQGFKHGADEVVLGLGFIIGRSIRLPDGDKVCECGVDGRVAGEVLPVGTLRQHHVEVVVCEQLTVGVVLRERELGYDHGLPVNMKNTPLVFSSEQEKL